MAEHLHHNQCPESSKTGICSRQDAKNAKFGSLISLRPLRLWREIFRVLVAARPHWALCGYITFFLRAIVEGIQLFKNDREASIRAMAKYLRIEDREALETYRIYQPIPFPSAAAI